MKDVLAPNGGFVPSPIESKEIEKEHCFLVSDSVLFNPGSKFHLESCLPLLMVHALLWGNPHQAILTPRITS